MKKTLHTSENYKDENDNMKPNNGNPSATAPKNTVRWQHILHTLFRPFSIILKYVLLLLINVYRYGISPLTPSSCRHVPTCSAYTIEAIKVHGPLKGTWLGLKRLSKCHPWGTSGYDPVPEKNPRIKVKKYK